MTTSSSASTSTPRPEAPPAARRLRGLGLAAVLVLFVLPLALRLFPIGHGLPRNYVPDSNLGRTALGIARDRNPVPPVGRYTTYPYLVPYLLVPVYAGWFAAGVATGEWSGAEEFGIAVTEDPSRVHLIARVVIALFGALTPWVLFRTARAVGLRRGAWVAAWMVATGLLHTHFSVQDRPWVPMVFFMALSGWAAALYARDRRARHLVVAGVLAGLSASCHQAGLFALGLPGLAWLQVAIGAGRELPRRIAVGFATVSAFAVVALVIGHPFYLVPGGVPAEAVIGGGAGDLTVGGQSHNFGWSLASLAHLSRAFAGYDPALLLLALPGLLLAVRARAARPVALFALLWAAYFLPHENDHVRYLLPLAVLLALPAGCAAEALLARGRWAPFALAPLLAFPLVQDLRLGFLLTRPDTRALAEAAVPAALPPGARLAIDRYGPDLELSAESLELLADLRAARRDTLTTREAHRAERLAAGERTGGLDGVFVRELFAFEERDGTVALRPPFATDTPFGAPTASTTAELRAALDALGVTHLLLVTREPEGSLIAPLVAGVEPLLELDPALPGRQPEHLRLPLEMEFPLLSLWQVARPGPRMALYALP